MANGYACARCGWQETPHVEGEWTLPEIEKFDLENPQPGFEYSFFQCQSKGGYVLSAEEKAAETVEEEKSGKDADQFNPGWLA